MSVYSIAPTLPFAHTLAQYAHDLAVREGIPLSAIKIFLPTRRGVRTLQEAFLRLSGGKPRILPIMQSIGDVDLDEVGFYDPALVDIPPAISSLRRQMILAQMIERAFPDNYNYLQAIAVAKDLGGLIDQIHTEDISINNLDAVLADKEFASYWQITVSFLQTILGELWPVYLDEIGMVDPGMQRRMRIKALSQHYATNPPKTPVIMAGSTGSIPVVRDFIKILNDSENGHIILPGLDKVMDDKSWFEVGHGHPQFLLKSLLSVCDVNRHDVFDIGVDDNATRSFVASEMMRPATTTHQWQELYDDACREKIEKGVNGVTVCHGDNDHHEASVIALAMAEIAHDPDQLKTATLITPNRLLAMRVQSILQQWGIDIDDSGGTSLPNTSLGQFCRHVVSSFKGMSVDPIAFLSALKNTYVGGGTYEGEFRTHIRAVEKDILRGSRPDGLPNEWSTDHKDFLNMVETMFAPLLNVQDGFHDIKSLVIAHVQTMENIAVTKTQSGAERLWCGDAGEALSLFFQNVIAQDDVTPSMSLGDYIEFISMMLSGESVVAKYGKHPRLSILGQIESRMVMADRVILSGLNEGVWPPDSGFDVWMSRGMRSNFGLPSLEQKTTLAAHDFASGFCAPEVFITRSCKSGGQPTQMSRWLQRLKTILIAANVEHDKWPDARGHQYEHWAREVRKSPHVTPFDRPAPSPDISRRPTQFSVTEIEKWMRDPYTIYAKKILRLKPMDKVDRALNVADRGTIIHGVVEKFTCAYPTLTLPHDVLEKFIQMGRDEFTTLPHNAEVHGLWWPRFEKMANWFVGYENDWRREMNAMHSESKGAMVMEVNGADFTLTAKADRIENRLGNHIAVIDYKTGAPPKPQAVNAGLSSQLPLEALIISKGGFDNVIGDQDTVYDLLYWNLSGAGEGGEVTPAQGKTVKDTQAIIDQAQDGVHALFTAFHNEHMPYLGSPDPDNMIKEDYNDYAHLERIAEWSVMEDGNNDA
jgi:ATP-dependent helicase/nuclease subunit B